MEKIISFKAEDGQIFKSEKECKEYEKKKMHYIAIKNDIINKFQEMHCSDCPFYEECEQLEQSELDTTLCILIGANKEE